MKDIREKYRNYKEVLKNTSNYSKGSKVKFTFESLQRGEIKWLQIFTW
ncbi:hypothetical protein L21TH_2332 [Caldisalinibacter kiritimatiensis]|uniref:Uncharacterized protein n=1 Tax=Caldisalinibacter kiritimatiensis TaxID=1304284 RepID=R1CBJ5_9FIRM|nr:hypothetical protein L21TH_2332 [Caldisalinibacter kiritimatiensis]